VVTGGNTQAALKYAAGSTTIGCVMEVVCEFAPVIGVASSLILRIASHMIARSRRPRRPLSDLMRGFR
jgi:hypothetical protein